MKDEMKKRTSDDFIKAALAYDFLGWGKSKRKVYNQMRRRARRTMKHDIRNGRYDC